MKKVLMGIFLMLMAMSASSQKWDQIIGEPYRNDYSRRVIEHYDKGYIITATFTAGYNDGHGWLLKTDINGNVLWDKEIGINPDQVIIEKTVFDGQGNIYIFGLLLQDLDHEFPVLIKLNACGEKQWCRLLNITGYEYGYFMDGIILDNGDLLGLANMPDEEQYDMVYLFRISPDGDYIWRKSFASVENHPLFEMRHGSRIQKFGDIYIISGYVYSPHPDYPTISSIRPMFIGIDTLFNEQWVLEFGMIDNMKGKALTSIPINDSLFMGVGRYRYISATGETKDAWAMFYNDEGEQVGQQVLTTDQFSTGVNESTFYEIERVNDSVFLATAGFHYNGESNAHGEILFDTAGTVYNFEIRDEVDGTPYILKTFDGKYAIATSTLYGNLTWDIVFYKINENLEHDTVYPGSYTYDSLCPDLPIESSIIDLTGCDIITNLDEIPSLEDYNKGIIVFKVYPNPSKDYVILEYKIEAEGLIEIKNITGKTIKTISTTEKQDQVTVLTENWQTGVYIANLTVNGKSIESVKFTIVK